MARKVNKSAEVRKILTENPDMGPTEISNALKSRKIVVSPNFVSNVKLKLKNGNGSGRGRKIATMDDVLAAAQLIKTCGGIENAKRALDLAEMVVAVSK